MATDAAAYPSVASVMETILRGVQENCGAFMGATQTASCTVLAQACSNVHIQCGNSAVQTFICYDTDSLLQLAANALLVSGPDLFFPADAGDVTEANIRNAIVSRIQATCAQATSASSATLLDIVCTQSRGVLVEAMNRLDQSALCIVQAAGQVYLQALRDRRAPQIPYVPPVTDAMETAFIWGVSVAALALVLLIVVPSAVKIRADAKAGKAAKA